MNERQLRCGSWLQGIGIGLLCGLALAAQTRWPWEWLLVLGVAVSVFGFVLEHYPTVWHYVWGLLETVSDWFVQPSASGPPFGLMGGGREGMPRWAAVATLREMLRQGRSLEEAVWELHHVRGVDLLALWPVVAEVTGLDHQEAMRLVVQATSLLRMPPFPAPLPPLPTGDTIMVPPTDSVREHHGGQ